MTETSFSHLISHEITVFLNFVFVFLRSIDHDKVTHIRGIYHWFLRRTRWFESIDAVNMFGIIIDILIAFCVSVVI